MLLTLLVLVVGLFMYVLFNRPELSKLAEVGRIMFGVGLLVLLRSMAGYKVPGTLANPPFNDNTVGAAILCTLLLAFFIVWLVARYRPYKPSK